jgi:hypothetical protein
MSGVNTLSSTPEEVLSVSVESRPATWRPTALELSYILVRAEPSGQRMGEIYSWAVANGHPNPRVISPFLLELSAVFNPSFFHAAAARHGTDALRPAHDCCHQPLSAARARLRFRLQSVLFLSAVTMSAAVVQSRWSSGTVASKYDKLWQAGQLADEGVAPELRGLELKQRVLDLVADRVMADLERLLAVRALFEAAIDRLATPIVARSATMGVDHAMARSARFGFVDRLRRAIPALDAVVVYGSSLSSEHFADYDLILVCEQPIAALRALAGTSPVWHGKELNVGVYSRAELWRMQLLSGDNLSDYGVCLFGTVTVPYKPVTELLARNMSFGLIRQRQQLGMIAAALAPSPAENGDDRRNLYDYFVKIPANIVKGTFGATGVRMTKESVQSWLLAECDFDTARQQQRVGAGDPGAALAASAVATGAALRVLNERFSIVLT